MAPKFFGDIETGHADGLYPNMMESPEMRWAFIRKVYSILTMQLFLTVLVAAAVVSMDPLRNLILSRPAGLVIYICSFVFALIFMCALMAFHNRHPVNMILLTLFTFCMAFSIGFTCAHTRGKIVLEAAILTCVVAGSLTLYTFWGVKRGQDFSFLGPFLFGALLVLMVFGLIQLIVPLGNAAVMGYACLGAIIFCGYIVYDTNNLIKRHTYDEYILASVNLYMDLVNLFLFILTILNIIDD